MKKGKLPKKIRLALCIGLPVLVLLGGGLFVAARMKTARTAMAAAAAAQTITLQKADITKSISASGVVKSESTVNIYSTLTYPMQEIFVQAGDPVQAGDVLAQLDMTNAQNDLAQAEINLGSAKASAKEEKRNLADSAANAKTQLQSAQISLERQQISTAQAEKDLAQTQADAEKPFDSYTYDNAIKDAKTALERKTLDYSTALGDVAEALLAFDDYTYQNAIKEAKIALDRKKAALEDAQNDLSKAQNDYDSARYYTTYNSASERDAAVEAAKKAYDAAQKAHDSAKNAVDDAQRAYSKSQTDLSRAKNDAVKKANDACDTAKKAKDDAQRAYDKALSDKDRAAADYVKDNDTKVTKAKNALADSKKQLQAAQNSVQSAKNSLQQAQAKPGSAGTNVELQELSLEKLERQLAQGMIVATAGGIVTEINAKTGATPSGVLFVIDDVDDIYVSAKVKEYNLPSLALGQDVIITTDATGTVKYSAALSYISPKAVSEAGSTSVEFEVRAKLADPDEAIKIGMNAYLNIVTQTRQNVYSVPISAVVTNEKGSFVYAQETQPQGKPSGKRTSTPSAKQEIPVTLGVKTSTNVEIAGEGLRDGLQILTDPENKLSDGSSNAGFGFPMGGRG